MDNNVTNLCPICWEEFENPKLLPCRHTFCAKCLKRFVASSDGKDKLTCPMCRAVWDLPQGGVGKFMGNYFVDNHNNKTLNGGKNRTCNFCKKRNESEVKTCFHCGQDMCLLCKLSHEKVLMFSGISVPNTESVYDLNSMEIEENEHQLKTRRRRNSTDVAVPFHLLLSLDPIKSNRVVSLESSFQIEITNQFQDRHFINCVCPVSINKCWVIPTAGPIISLYDITGKQEKEIMIFSEQVRDIAYRKSDNSLLIAFVHSNRILRYNNNNLTFLCSTGNTHPYGIDTFPDDRIAVVCASLFGNAVDDEYGELLIFSYDGAFLKSIGKIGDKNMLKRPFSVVVNRISSRIFVSDRGNNSVFVFSEEDNQLKHRYTGTRGDETRLVFKIEHHFRPISIAQDNDGNVLVIDAASATIHILNPEGIFLGLVLTTSDGNFGNPLSIGVDPEGKIWIGDNNDKCVRIFRCISYMNTLHTDATLEHLQSLNS